MALKEIKKRNGKVVAFDKTKIHNAINNALKACEEKDLKKVDKLTNITINELEKNVYDNEVPTVERIQDTVEKVLVENGDYKIAKAYILYRKQHENLRNVKQMFSNLSLVEDYINLKDWKVKENANMSYSLQGLNFHISSKISSEYWLNKIYPPEIKQAHKNSDLHIHDLGMVSVYCVGWDLKDLLTQGFKGVSGKIECKPAKHFKSALGQIVNFFYTLQGEAAGAQALSNFDTYLAPFIKYDQLNYKQVKQALQEFIFNINIPTRVGFQTPFTNITLDLEVPEFMKNEPVIIAGKLENQTYSQFQEEMDIFNQAFAEVMMQGDANARVFTFPIPTYNITKKFNFNNPRYEKIWEMTSKYGIPYFSNFVNSDLSPDDVRSMCCRLRLDKRELNKRGGGLFGSNPLTGSIGVVTINLPRIGYLSRTQDEYFTKLSNLMDIAKDSLETKRKILETLTEQGLYPYSKFYLRNIKQRFGQYWKNHFATIGLVGMNESCLNFLGQSLGETKANQFAQKVLDFMRNKLEEYQKETQSIYNLEATPAEGTSYRLAKSDFEKYPDIIFANEKQVRENNAKPYYTNSSQLHVNFTDDLFEALDIQDKLQIKYTGGTVFHTFIGESQLSTKSIKNLIDKITKNYELPYFTLSPTFSICPNHGYIYSEHKTCPKCSREGITQECEVYSRIVGYLRPIQQWNEGKFEEYKQRNLFDKKIT